MLRKEGTAGCGSLTSPGHVRKVFEHLGTCTRTLCGLQVGAPSLPNLLGALDPLAGGASAPGADGGAVAGLDPGKLLSSLAVGECPSLVSLCEATACACWYTCKLRPACGAGGCVMHAPEKSCTRTS